MPISALTTNILIGVVTGFITSTFAPPGWGIIRKTMAERLKAGGEPINHDLQRACQRAFLEATLFVCKTDLKRFDLNPNPKKNLLHHDEEARILSAFYINIDDKRREVCNPKHIPSEYVQFDPKLLLQPKLEDLDQVRKNFQEAVIQKLLEWQKDLPESFLKMIREGWEKDGRTFDWFDSVCLCFANILKTDQKVRAIFSSEILVENNAILESMRKDFDKFIKPLIDVVWRIDETTQRTDETVQRTDEKEIKNTLHGMSGDNASCDPSELSQEIRKVVEKDKLPIDPDLTLKQIYVPPSTCYWDDKTVKPTSDKEEKDNTNKISLMDSLLSNIEESNSPIVVHGQPGHGKTSTVRMLAYEIVERDAKEGREPNYVLMYEFKNLGRLDANDEIQILNKRTPFIKDESFFHGKNTVLILDGMDERQITDGSDIALKDFVRNMFRLSGEINRWKDSRLNLILTGRSQFVKQVRSAFNRHYNDLI